MSDEDDLLYLDGCLFPRRVVYALAAHGFVEEGEPWRWTRKGIQWVRNTLSYQPPELPTVRA